MRRQVLLQELHLVGENAAVGEDQVLGLVRNVRRVEQLQAGLLRQAVALVPVAVPAGGDDVHPGVASAARQRRDVVARQPEVAELAAAVRAHVPVAPEQLAVVQRRHVVEAFRCQRLALDGDDGVGGDARALAGQPADAAVISEGLVAQRPRDQVLRVVEARLLPADPAVRHAVAVEREDERLVHVAGIVLRGFCQAFPCFAMPKKTRGCESHPRRRQGSYLSTASLKPCPAAKAGMVLAGILISLPLEGLRPARAFLFRGRNVPKPMTVTRLPLATLATIASNTALTASPAADLLRLLAFAATWTRSDLVTTCGMCSPSFRPLCGRRASGHRIQIARRTQRIGATLRTRYYKQL